MRLFLAVLEGPNPKDATPIFATEDPELIQAVAEALAKRMGGDSGLKRVLSLYRDTDHGNGGEPQ